MNNNPLLDWNNLQYFVLLVEHETLTATAEIMNVQHSTVARRIADLERELGIALFDRIGKRYLVTADGKQVYQHAHKLAKDIGLLQHFTKKQASLSVQVVISATPVIAREVITPNLAKFYKMYNNIVLTIHSSAQTSDLHEKQADIALRMVYPTKSDLMVRRLRTLSFGFFARPDYLANTPIQDRRYLTLSTKNSLSSWCNNLIGEQQMGLVCNDFEVIKRAALDGVGVGFLPHLCAIDTPLMMTGVGDKTIQMATLKKPLYLVSHQDVRRLAAVNAVADFLVEILADESSEFDE